MSKYFHNSALCRNIPISIGRLLAAWHAAQAFSQTVKVSASLSDGSMCT